MIGSKAVSFFPATVSLTILVGEGPGSPLVLIGMGRFWNTIPHCNHFQAVALGEVVVQTLEVVGVLRSGVVEVRKRLEKRPGPRLVPRQALHPEHRRLQLVGPRNTGSMRHTRHSHRRPHTDLDHRSTAHTGLRSPHRQQGWQLQVEPMGQPEQQLLANCTHHILHHHRHHRRMSRFGQSFAYLHIRFDLRNRYLELCLHQTRAGAEALT